MFKAYDIRGIAGDEITPEFANRLGKAVATHLDVSAVAVARDIRESGPDLHSAFIEGVISTGADVLDLGVTTTGVLYRATVDLPVQAAVAITASHNPPEYNGFKICHGKLPIAGDELQDLKETFDVGKFNEGQGVSREVGGFEDHYIRTVVENAGKPARPVKIVVDCGNAVPGPLATRVMDALGVEAIPLYCEWDSSFPNHPPDPTRPKNMIDLSAAVVEHGAEFGIGMDGDGDRIGVVDEAGRFIHPDRLMAVMAKDVLSNLPEDADDDERTVYFDVKCSMALEEAIESAGGLPKMVRTGHSFMKRELRNNPMSPMAGEMSGHFFLHDRWPGFDDSLYNAARLLEIIGRDSSPLDGGPTFSDRFSFLPDYPSTGEAKIPLPGEREQVLSAVAEAFADMEFSTVDGIRVRYDDGWCLCRASNTEAILVMRAEGRTEAALGAILTDVNARLGQMLDLSALH